MPEVEQHLRLPKILYIETTNRCNLRCKGCILYRGSWEPDRDMSLADFIRITDQLPDLQQAYLHGIGEPLLNRELPDIIRHLKSRSVYALFNSNGILLNAQRQHELVSAGLDELRISLDAASTGGYQKIRGSDRFEQIVANLKSLRLLQKQRHVTYPKLSLWFLGTRDNISELPGLIALAAEIGIGEVYLQRLVFFQDDEGYGVARATKTLQDSTDGSSNLIKESQEMAAKLGVRLNASGQTSPVESLQGKTETGRPWRMCYRPLTLMYVTANGNVLPCCISPFATADYASILLGNAFENSLEEIWSGAAYVRFRTAHQTARPPQCCRGCGVQWSL
ncbi:MAG: SPASM domain-containing protein [Deltaproteobacteria bacterium]|nr:SPASM domain-containing protein [Deltaproteobacteria bacterium]